MHSFCLTVAGAEPGTAPARHHSRAQQGRRRPPAVPWLPARGMLFMFPLRSAFPEASLGVRQLLDVLEQLR